MAFSSPWRLAVATGAVCVLAGFSAVSPAGAAPAPAGKLMTEYLAAHPGGVPINDNEISYDGGRFIVTLERPPHTGYLIPDCPWNWFCFYDRIGYGYPRGRLSDCGSQHLSNWAWQYRTESVHYNMSSGRTAFYYGSQWLFEISPSRRTISNVTPYRNYADRVNRIC
nr:hypothetical protein [Micromonospora sp. DSM 115978]